ncbi:hypothetical protein HF086_009101 [Spodoptera exigua]|uniref:FP protein C-terminal domain-containing protein n=1 Tax=Spodoptera exigua TaxID=7107 RepID=A0A922SJP8_SPOEX|nr:hypothetical protein HF086_009101 [Spodoptera exigua]
MPGTKCGGCGRFISSQDGARCSKCLELYHKACVGIPTKAGIAQGWRCPECKKHIARDNRSETPVRGSAQGPSADMTEVADYGASRSPDAGAEGELSLNVCPEVAASAPLRSLSVVAGMNLEMIVVELRAVREDIKGFRKEMEVEMARLGAALSNCGARIDGLEARLGVLEQRAAANADTSCSNNLDKVLEDLRREMNDRDQDLLTNDVEVSNLPETKAENPVHLVKVIGRKLGVNFEDCDVVSAERVGGRQLNVTSSAGPTESRPRPLVVRFARRDLRDQLLSGARVRRGATTVDLDMPGPAQRFFVNERLTKINRQLFRRARDAASLHKWRFVWTKQGRIFARREPGDRAQRIRTNEDLCRIFGTANEETG